MTIPWRTVVRRLLSMMGTLLGVAIFVFIMLRAIPGNQITAGLGTEAAALTPEQRHMIYEGNARRVYPRLDAALKKKGL